MTRIPGIGDRCGLLYYSTIQWLSNMSPNVHNYILLGLLCLSSEAPVSAISVTFCHTGLLRIIPPCDFVADKILKDRHKELHPKKFIDPFLSLAAYNNE